MLHSYPTVYQIGHKAISDLFSGPVVLEEKIDGSQFSFGLIDGVLECRSKGKQLVMDAPEKMFVRAVDTVRELAPLLHPGWTYRGEYLEKPKHNVICYGRVPTKHLILFDVCTGIEEYLSPDEKLAEAKRLGLEAVPCFYSGAIHDFAMLNQLLSTDSVLGNAKIEGVVAKNYTLFTGEKKVAMGKYVSEAFKEKHASDWKEHNPAQGDMVSIMIAQLRTEARWQKAVQHLRENGVLTESPRDIGALIKEIQADVAKEEKENIKDELFAYFWPQIQRGVIAGAAEWYKAELAKKAFME